MSGDVTTLVKSVSNGGDEAAVMPNWKKVVTRIDPQVLTRNFGSVPAEDRILLASSAAPVVFVDYTEQYYVNAKVPLAGSANVDAKVAEDGSLSEASGQVQSKTFETIVGALPISSLITGALGVGGKAFEPGKIETFTLAISVSGYRHTLARLVAYPNSTVNDITPACPVVKDIAFADANEYKREDLSTATDSNKAEAKPDPGTGQKPGKGEKGKGNTTEKDSSAADDSAAAGKANDSAGTTASKGSSGKGNAKPKKKKT